MRRKNVIEIEFIIAYFIEQIAFILLSILLPQYNSIWIGVFPVIFLSTIAIEKVVLKETHENELQKYTKPGRKERKWEKDLASVKKQFFKK